ncbi:hypothetical protein AVEN_84219-1 [Araneus ventricosus]|uniref:Uncharacterized protein n=1 Tax=Araneus ventricosus TaxID=182803 RepID=A0A4Y2L290_ARAVE|nr:hypothetical protein AVEN_84219-1 [Araneus ventricosus]
MHSGLGRWLGHCQNRERGSLVCLPSMASISGHCWEPPEVTRALRQSGDVGALDGSFRSGAVFLGRFRAAREYGPEEALDQCLGKARWGSLVWRRALLVPCRLQGPVCLIRVQRNGAVSGFIFRKKKSNPFPYSVTMATTLEDSDMATHVVSDASISVVDAIQLKSERSGANIGAISKKLSRKDNLKVPTDVKGLPRPFGTNIDPPLERSSPGPTTWADTSARVNPNMIAPGDEGYEALHTTPLMDGTSTGFSVTSNSAGLGQGFFQSVRDNTSVETMADDTVDSESYQEALSTPQGRPPSLSRTQFLKDVPSSPEYFVVGTVPVPMKEESVSRRKRRNMARNSALGTKIKKGSSGDGRGQLPHPGKRRRKARKNYLLNFIVLSRTYWFLTLLTLNMSGRLKCKERYPLLPVVCSLRLT